jgi:hypothetical protein
MAVTYVRNESGVFEQVGPGGASTDTTLSQVGKPADAAAVGNAINNLNTAIQAQLEDKAPMYIYGNKDLTPGVSTLAAGTLYFYYTTS